MYRVLNLLVSSVAISLATPAQAQGYFGGNPESAPSVFTYAWRGFSLGAIDGLAVGYVTLRNNDFEGDDWKPLVYGAGIGALVGGGVGLGLGFVDLAGDHPGAAGIVLRDMGYGAGFGVAAGALTGALVMLDTDEPEYILYGASIGALLGTGVGLIVGLIEAPAIVKRRSAKPALQLQPSMAMTEDLDHALVWTPGVQGRF